MTASEPLHELPTAFRGYSRAATDAFLETLRRQHETLLAERNALRRQVDDLTRDLEEHKVRVQAVADALISAQAIATDLRTAAEAEIDELRRELDEERQRLSSQIDEERERLVEEGAGIRTQARQDATEIVREARIRADRLIDEVVAALHEYRHDTDSFLDATRQRLDSLVQELLERIPGTARDEQPPPQPTAVADDDASAPDVAAA